MKLSDVTPINVELSKAPLTVQEQIDEFLKTRQGLKCLIDRYPSLTLVDAINEFTNNWKNLLKQTNLTK